MTPERFQHLHELVEPYIVKKYCRSRATISPRERLCLCLRLLATGDSQSTQSFTFRVGKSTVSKIVKETCEGIWMALKDVYLKAPSKTEDWMKISKEFEKNWNFPNCLGALDGKHVSIVCPRNAGSGFYNYKHFHSIVLLAICDAKYCFSMVDVGGFGRDNDASILQESLFGRMFDSGPHAFNIPPPTNVGSSSLPYVLVSDEIFPLKPWLMKPYPGRNIDESQRIYNYRLSRARRTIENSFGILAARWRIYRRPIHASVESAEAMVRATICLHNYLQLTDNAHYVPAGFVDSTNSSGEVVPGDWREVVEGDESGLQRLPHIGGNRYTFEANATRSAFENYFNSEGAVEWQCEHVRSCGPIVQE